MANGNQTPPREPGNEEGGENRPQKPRNFASIALIGIVIAIVFLVVSTTNQDKDKVSFERMIEQLAEGRVKSLEVEQTALKINYTKAEKSGSSEPKKIGKISMSKDFAETWAPVLSELRSVGSDAADRSPTDVDAILRRLLKPKGEREEFAVRKRYIVKVDGQPALLVQMSVPPFQSGPDKPPTSATMASYLLKPTTLRSISDGKIERPVSFADLLSCTNTNEVNAQLGLPSVADVTIDMTGKNSALTFPEGSGFWESVLISLLPWVLIIAFLWFFIFRQMRGNGMGNNVLSFGRSRARMANREKSTVTFADVAGIEEAKDEVGEVVEFLKHPGKFARLGGRTPRGILLVGPPGTGKTLLAKAIAGEAEVPFYSICGSDFVEMFVGVGASRVRDLFKQARENSPCIIFLDEIDAVGRRRGAGLGGGHDEREQTLNAILVEMDGFETDTGIIVIAATNRVDVLDPALLRPGRFDREINVDLPDVKGREAILQVHSRRIRMHPSVNLEKIARGTPGFSGAEIEAVVNESAILATLAKKDYVFEEDLEEARDRVRWGRAKTSRIMDHAEQKVTAYHEAGHTLVSLLLPGADPIHKVTIIPRGQALGATMYLPEKDTYSITVGKATTHLKICFGGRIAEELFFADYTSGASNDIKQATAIARKMVKEWGMSAAVGPINYGDGDEPVFVGRDMGKQNHFSAATSDVIDSEVRRIIEEAYQATRLLIEENREKLVVIAENLLEYEVLTKDEIEGLMEGRSVEDVRALEIESRMQVEKASAEETPRSQPLTQKKPEPDPDPKLPPGLAGEGA